MTENNAYSYPAHTGAIPSPRYGHSAHVIRGIMYIFGGTDGRKYYNQIYALNLETWEWTLLETSNRIAPRERAASNTYMEKIMVFGGQNSNGVLHDGLFMFDVGARSWSLLENESNHPRGRVGACLVVNEKLKEAFLLGGREDGEEGVVSVYTLNLKSMYFLTLSSSTCDSLNHEVDMDVTVEKEAERGADSSTQTRPDQTLKLTGEVQSSLPPASHSSNVNSTSELAKLCFFSFLCECMDVSLYIYYVGMDRAISG